MFVPLPGMSTTVSRGMESEAFAPPPVRISMIESDRDGPPICEPGSASPLVRASEPSTRIVLAPTSGHGPASSSGPTWSARSPRRISADTMNRIAESAIQAISRPTTQRSTRPIRGRRGRRNRRRGGRARRS